MAKKEKQDEKELQKKKKLVVLLILFVTLILLVLLSITIFNPSQQESKSTIEHTSGSEGVFVNDSGSSAPSIPGDSIVFWIIEIFGAIIIFKIIKFF